MCPEKKKENKVCNNMNKQPARVTIKKGNNIDIT
jgi:hypothetical protein